MASIRFEIRSLFEQRPRPVWDALIDWEDHGAWIPATHTDVHSDDPTAVGATFTAFTGVGPLTLEDRMRIVGCDWDDAATTGTCTVEKLGPVLGGTASFTVEPTGDGSAVTWIEDVEVRHLPGFLAPVVQRISAIGFRLAMRRLGKVLARRATSSS